MLILVETHAVASAFKLESYDFFYSKEGLLLCRKLVVSTLVYSFEFREAR